MKPDVCATDGPDMRSDGRKSWLTSRLEQASVPLFTLYAVATAFTTYFCMYAFRKPWAAGFYEGEDIAGFELKSVLVVSQLVGYALSKLFGIKFNSEMLPQKRRRALIGLVVASEVALLVFALSPPALKPVALFFNGLPLGVIWGLVFSFLEGRRTSEMLGAGLSCSYIVASGAVKSVGRWFLDLGIPESWMPALTGAAFFPLFVTAVYGLSQLPPPSAEDIAARVERAPMYKAQRRAFLASFLFGITCLCIVYFFLTAYRDFRDSFAAEIFAGLGLDATPAVFTKSELPVAFTVLFALGLIYLIKSNRLGLIATYVMMLSGGIVLGLSTLAFDLGAIDGMTWMILVGIGVYLGYVPFGCVLFDRMIAALGTVGTAVFLVYLTDAVGYGGSVLVVLYKEIGHANISMLDFFLRFSYATSIAASIGFLASGIYFWRRSEPGTESVSQLRSDEPNPLR